MKLMHILSGLSVAIILAGCAQSGHDAPASTADGGTPSTIAQPSVSGTVWLPARVELPPDAVLTVTLSDASQADTPSKVISQQAVYTRGKPIPFHFALPFNPADIKPDARILLSAAIAINGQLVYVTETVKPVINQGGTKADLTLVQVQQTAVPVRQP